MFNKDKNNLNLPVWLMAIGILLLGVSVFYVYLGKPTWRSFNSSWNTWQLNRCVSNIKAEPPTPSTSPISLYEAFKSRTGVFSEEYNREYTNCITRYGNKK